MVASRTRTDPRDRLWLSTASSRTGLSSWSHHGPAAANRSVTGCDWPRPSAQPSTRSRPRRSRVSRQARYWLRLNPARAAAICAPGQDRCSRLAKLASESAVSRSPVDAGRSAIAAAMAAWLTTDSWTRMGGCAARPGGGLNDRMSSPAPAGRTFAMTFSDRSRAHSVRCGVESVPRAAYTARYEILFGADGAYVVRDRAATRSFSFPRETRQAGGPRASASGWRTDVTSAAQAMGRSPPDLWLSDRRTAVGRPGADETHPAVVAGDTRQVTDPPVGGMAGGRTDQRMGPKLARVDLRRVRPRPARNTAKPQARPENQLYLAERGGFEPPMD